MSVLRHDPKLTLEFGTGHVCEAVLPTDEANNENLLTLTMDVDEHSEVPDSGVKKALALMKGKGMAHRKDRKRFFRLRYIHASYVYELQPERSQETVSLSGEDLVVPVEEAPLVQVDSETLNPVGF